MKGGAFEERSRGEFEGAAADSDRPDGDHGRPIDPEGTGRDIDGT